MRVLSSPQALAAENIRVSMAAGFFDGVHCGHRSVLAATVEHARATGGQSWALTFEPHPMAVLVPERRPPLLTPLKLRLELLASTGLDGCLLMPFDVALSKLAPSEFINNVLCTEAWAPTALFAGENFRFGAGGRGSIHDISELSGGRISGNVVHHELDELGVISSTRIRQAIKDGDLRKATKLLGRPHIIDARVIAGRRQGKRLGFATANLATEAEVLPPFGIYALWARCNGLVLPAVSNFGMRPTFPEAAWQGALIEVHLLDFDGDLYGSEIEVAFVARLRDELRFDSAEELVERIKLDVVEARRALAEIPVALPSWREIR